MKVLITAHVSAGKFQFLIQLDPPLPMSVKCSCEIQSVSVEQVCTKVLASQNVFAAGLEQKSYFLAMPAHRRPQPTSIEPEEVFTCDVYCMVLDPESSEGMSRAKLVSEFQSAFDQLSHLSTGMVTPWISPAPKDSDRCSYDIKKGFDSCVTMSDSVYQPGSVFLVTDDDPNSATCTCSSGYSAPVNDNAKEFGKAYRETENADDPSLVGIPSKPLVPKSLSKSDTTRREQVAIKPPPITSHLSSLNALQPHRDLVGTPQQVTPGTPTKTVVKEGIPGAPSHKDWYGIDTSVTKHPLGLSQADSPALRASLRLEAECGALKVSDSSCGNDDGGDVVEREGGDDSCAVEEESKPGSQQPTAPDCTNPPVTYDSPPAHRTLLTNGLALPTINPPSDGTSLVPGVKSLKIPQTAASVTLNNVAQNLSKQVDGIPRVNSDPQFCSKAEQNEEPLKKAKSCDMLQLDTTERVDPPLNMVTQLDSTERVDPPSNMVTQLDTTERDDPPLNMVIACEVDRKGGVEESERKHLLMAGATYVLQSSPGENRQQVSSGNLLEQNSKAVVVPPSPHAAAPLAPVPSVAVPQDELDMELKRVHALEHACNGYCNLANEEHLSELCADLYDEVMVDGIKQHLEAYRSGSIPLDDVVKTLIVRHCSHCRDSTCRVPHVAAGCLPAGQNSISSHSAILSKISNSTPSHSPLPSTSHHPSFPPSSPSHSHSPVPSSPILPTPNGIGRVSFDLYPANLSESPPPLSPLRAAACGTSVGLRPANVSESPTRKKTASPVHTSSPHAGHPVTLHTASDSDSPHYHPHVALCPSRKPLTDDKAMVVRSTYMYMRPPGVEPALLQGTFPPRRRYGYYPATRPRLPTEQLTEDPDENHSQPRPHPVAPSDGQPKQQPIWKSTIPGEFPSERNCVGPHTVLFSSQMNIVVGSQLPLDTLDTQGSSHRLGKGGNGDVVRYPLLNVEYAVKSTGYRPTELTHWHKFDHPNVTKLLMVCTSPAPSKIYQFMHLMDDSLSRVLTAEGMRNGVCSLYTAKCKWDAVVMPNVRHIIRGILSGTAYLHEDMCIQHVDLKASNILIKKQCYCVDIFTCECQDHNKCLVQLADFDSVKPFQRKQFLECLEWEPYVPMSPTECKKVMGTPGYRAPEQFMKLAPVISPNHSLYGKSLEGPWTDMWNMGHICMTIFLGPNKQQDKHEAWMMHGRPYVKEFSRTDTQPEITHAILRSRQLSLSTPREAFTAASDFTAACIQPHFRMRPTAQELLDHELLRHD